MEAIYKNTRQQEFCQLLEKMDGWGFKPADVARLIKKSRGAVSQYVSGYGNPSETTLDLMRKVVNEEESKRNGPKPETVSDNQVHEQLGQLREYAPADYQAAVTIIGTLHQKLPMAILNSSTKDAAKRAAKKTVVTALKRLPPYPHQSSK